MTSACDMRTGASATSRFGGATSPEELEKRVLGFSAKAIARLRLSQDQLDTLMDRIQQPVSLHPFLQEWLGGGFAQIEVGGHRFTLFASRLYFPLKKEWITTIQVGCVDDPSLNETAIMKYSLINAVAPEWEWRVADRLDDMASWVHRKIKTEGDAFAAQGVKALSASSEYKARLCLSEQDAKAIYEIARPTGEEPPPILCKMEFEGKQFALSLHLVGCTSFTGSRNDFRTTVQAVCTNDPSLNQFAGKEERTDFMTFVRPEWHAKILARLDSSMIGGLCERAEEHRRFGQRAIELSGRLMRGLGLTEQQLLEWNKRGLSVLRTVEVDGKVFDLIVSKVFMATYTGQEGWALLIQPFCSNSPSLNIKNGGTYAIRAISPKWVERVVAAVTL